MCPPNHDILFSRFKEHDLKLTRSEMQAGAHHALEQVLWSACGCSILSLRTLNKDFTVEYLETNFMMLSE